MLDLVLPDDIEVIGERCGDDSGVVHYIVHTLSLYPLIFVSFTEVARVLDPT